MKKVLLIVFATAFLFSCRTSLRQIGKVNMVSHRNIDSDFDYVQLATYTGSDERELKKSTAPNIETAVSERVKNTPGGEFLMNVKIYIVDEQYFAVAGDVWGRKQVTYKGFEVGHTVSWKKRGTIKKGVLKSFKDAKTCIVELPSGDLIEKEYIEISNLGKQEIPEKVDHSKKFKIGDNITFKWGPKLIEGKILGLNEDYAIVEYESVFGKTKQKEVKYDIMTIIEK